MILLIDNYDSFVHNLARHFECLDQPTVVVRNDQLTPEQALQMAPTAIVISPGPRSPREAGVSVPLVQACTGIVPILGICLGHQAIAAAFGGRIIRSKQPMHGRPSLVIHDDQLEFAGLPNPLEAGRYHSLAVDEHSLPAQLSVSACTEDGTIMGLRHVQHPVIGWQFHPESILTECGPELLSSFLKMTDDRNLIDSSHSAINRKLKVDAKALDVRGKL